MEAPSLIPVRFGAPEKQLFGIFHPPAGGPARADCVVVCNPFGQEAILAHRTLRLVAERLAREGFPVLRFDYSGTGDSDGDDDVGSLALWAEDVARADLEAKRLSGHHRGAWLGVRMGGTLAAMATARARMAPAHLVLWDPVLDGRAYLESLFQAHDAYLEVARLPQRTNGADDEALGFPLRPEVKGEIAAIDAGTLFAASRAARTSIVCGPGPDAAALDAAAPGGPPQVVRTAARVDWATQDALNSSVVPADAVDAVVQALARA